MNRRDLRMRTRQEGIPDDAYVVEGEHGADDPTILPKEYGGIYVLRTAPGGWVLFVSERGAVLDEEFFDTEDEACHELLLRVLADRMQDPSSG